MKQQQQKDHNHKAELKLHQGNRLEKKKNHKMRFCVHKISEFSLEKTNG